MALRSCLSGCDEADVPRLEAVLRMLEPGTVRIEPHLGVAELSRYVPDLLVCDVDRLEADPLEMLRRLRFVLPRCSIAVYSGNFERAWGRACHLAGANCLLAKSATPRQLTAAIRYALRAGCYTDPRFAKESTVDAR